MKFAFSGKVDRPRDVCTEATYVFDENGTRPLRRTPSVNGRRSCGVNDNYDMFNDACTGGSHCYRRNTAMGGGSLNFPQTAAVRDDDKISVAVNPAHVSSGFIIIVSSEKIPLGSIIKISA